MTAPPSVSASSRTVPSAQGYAEQAAELIPQYEAVAFEAHHAQEMHLLPTAPSRVLDIGAGTGADAAWFAARGHQVLAVEPTAEFRQAGQALHPSPRIEWLDDALPGLALVLARREMFDVVMLSAVWMHLDEAERREGMPRLASLLAPGGVLMLSLRHGPVPAGRRMFAVSPQETVELASRSGLQAVLNVPSESIQPRNIAAGVTWTKLALRHRPVLA